MGGGISLTAAGTYPDRVAAAASFHGGNLATDSELSPHRLAPRWPGGYMSPGLTKTTRTPPKWRPGSSRRSASGRGSPLRDLSGGVARLDDTDFPVYNEAAAERHWEELRLSPTPSPKAQGRRGHGAWVAGPGAVQLGRMSSWSRRGWSPPFGWERPIERCELAAAIGESDESVPIGFRDGFAAPVRSELADTVGETVGCEGFVERIEIERLG